MKINFYNTWSPLFFARGFVILFTRPKFIDHSWVIRFVLLHHELTLAITWINHSPVARY